ncbi:ABC transporter substrate-binding protein [Microcella flavibacter]|uniref:ABC transporter substrate-binding protein n=1 Tax=Microcella flavibacter TaxID=1804990 RepID=UPI0014563CE2|nr:ABC transporter substrate-binding protein [Microcella flavibacter]
MSTFLHPSSGGRRRRLLTPIALAGASVLMLAACSTPTLGGADGDGGGDENVIRIGYVTPQTGPLAAFGEADSFVLDQVRAYYEENGVVDAAGTEYSVEIIVADTQSDPARAADVAAELILDDGVDMILASSTPETTNPVSDQCEANQVLCITTVAPWQAWYFGRGGTPDAGFDYTYHFFWGLGEVGSVYSELWAAVPDGGSVAQLLPNDADGNAWADTTTGFAPIIEGGGLAPVNPGAYPNGQADFSAQISAFQEADADILMGVPIPPDFTTFWQQAIQQGYQPQMATIAKALLFPSAVEALGANGENIATEVWWSPSHPFSSSLTGQSAEELAAAYEEETGRQWTQPLGFAHALFEVATATIAASDSIETDDLRGALAGLSTDTVAGTIDFTAGPVPNVSLTPLVGGQWRGTGDGTYELVIVANADNPEIPTGGEIELIDWSNR